MGDLVNLHCVTRLGLPEGQFYFASTYADGCDVLWLLEKAKLALLRVGRQELE